MTLTPTIRSGLPLLLATEFDMRRALEGSLARAEERPPFHVPIAFDARPVRWVGERPIHVGVAGDGTVYVNGDRVSARAVIERPPEG